MKTILILVSMLVFSVNTYGAIAPDGDYILDKKHANVGFSVSHLGISNVIGRFTSFDGKFVFISNGDSKVEFEIDANSVDTNQSRRDDHIRSEDFFDVANFPKIRFTSTKITYDSNGDPELITGLLFMHGVTNEMSFEVSAIGAGDVRGEFHAGYSASGKLNRSDFGISSLPAVVGDEIKISVDLEIIKQ